MPIQWKMFTSSVKMRILKPEIDELNAKNFDTYNYSCSNNNCLNFNFFNQIKNNNVTLDISTNTNQFIIASHWLPSIVALTKIDPK
jgi:hypothetical protein